MILQEAGLPDHFHRNLEIFDGFDLPLKFRDEIELAIELQKSFEDIFQNLDQFEPKNLVKRSEEVQEPAQRVYQVRIGAARIFNSVC